MTKEPGQPPKAVNIIRPSSNYGLLHNTTSTSSSGSSNGGSIVQKRNGSIHSNNSSVLSSNRKPRVNSAVKVLEKPVLNLYHPPTRKPSYDDYHRSNSSSFISSLRPPIEIYNPQQQKQLQQQQQRMTKSFTAPSLTSEQLQPIHPTAASATVTNNNYTRPISPSYIRPSHRSVLGPINAPVAATTITSTINNIEKPQDIAPIIVEPLVEPNDNTFLLLDNTIKTIDDEDSDNYEEDIDDDDNGEEENEEEEEEEEEEPVINEARVNRKIADLELSINSLLTVNAMLEATVRKQASQLSQMKNKMLSGESVDMILDEVSILDGDRKNDDDESDGEKEEDWEQDLVFQRLKKVTEYMIEQGQKSIDFEYKILGRVLSNYAPEEDDEEDDEDEDEDEDEEEDNTIEEKEEEKTLSLTPTSTTSSTATITTTKNSIASSIPVPSSIPSNTTTTTTTSTTNANTTTTTRISKLAKRRIN